MSHVIHTLMGVTAGGQYVPDGTCSKVLRSPLLTRSILRASNFSWFEIEINILRFFLHTLSASICYSIISESIIDSLFFALDKDH